MNARDLSEPPRTGRPRDAPSVATSQLPMVSAHATKEPLRTRESGRFWTGVAQITRSRDRAFAASHCSLTLFSISSIWRVDRCTGNRSAGFPPCAPLIATNRATAATGSSRRILSERSAKKSRYFGNQAATRDLACRAARSRQARDSPRAADGHHGEQLPHHG